MRAAKAEFKFVINRLNRARLELQRALEAYPSACELDPATRQILKAVVATTAARRKLLQSPAVAKLRLVVS
jgi:hypothetical protein